MARWSRGRGARPSTDPGLPPERPVRIASSIMPGPPPSGRITMLVSLEHETGFYPAGLTCDLPTVIADDFVRRGVAARTPNVPKTRDVGALTMKEKFPESLKPKAKPVPTKIPAFRAPRVDDRD